MNLSDLASLGSFISGFGILISLIFLYFQLRQVGRQVAQAERNQQASIRQGRAGRSVAIAMGTVEPAVAEALLKAQTGAEDITTTQMMQFSNFCTALLFSFEDIFYQHQDGLLSDSAFSSTVNSMQYALRSPAIRVQWKRRRGAHGAEFVEFADGLIARTPVRPLSFDPAEWLADLAIERSDAPN